MQQTCSVYSFDTDMVNLHIMVIFDQISNVCKYEFTTMQYIDNKVDIQSDVLDTYSAYGYIIIHILCKFTKLS